MAAKKGGLGRGLDLLFQDTGASSADDGVTMLRLTEVEPDKAQPRKHFDDAALGELADSISPSAILQILISSTIFNSSINSSVVKFEKS